MSPESRLPARSVLLLRRGVHWTPAPSKAAGAIYPFSGSKNLPLNDSKPTACLCLLKAKLLINAIPHKECSADANNGKAQADAALSRQAVSRRCCLESPDFVNFSAAPLRQRKLY